jgi:hypothetical protein
MANKVTSIEFIVPTLVVIVLGIALSICAVYAIDSLGVRSGKQEQILPQRLRTD